MTILYIRYHKNEQFEWSDQELQTADGPDADTQQASDV